MSASMGSSQGQMGPAGGLDPSVNLVSLVLDGVAWKGWVSCRITSAIERFPSSFDLVVTELYPGSASKIDIRPGASCQVLIGKDPIITGWVDRYAASIDANRHEITISGRGKCEDLVDCTVDLQGCTINNTTMLGLAQQLAQPYGITVTAPSGAGTPISAVNFFITQTPYEVIEQAARYCGLLVYEGPDGGLILDTVGSTSMASGFVEGVNIERASVDFNISGRFSDYRFYVQSTDFLLNGGGISPGTDPNRLAVATDPTIRHRVHAEVAQTGQNIQALAQLQAIWELNRRRGRSQSIHLTTDMWRDSAGSLWRPNALVQIVSPTLKISQATWLISEVTFVRDGTGQHAELVLMPPSAFAVQPSNLYMFDPNVMAALAAGQGGAQLPVAGAPATGGASS